MVSAKPAPCTACGSEQVADATVCGQCGAPLVGDGTAQVPPEPPSLLQEVLAQQKRVAQQLAPLETERHWWKKYL